MVHCYGHSGCIVENYCIGCCEGKNVVLLRMILPVA